MNRWPRSIGLLLSFLLVLGACSPHKPRQITLVEPLPPRFAGGAGEAAEMVEPWWEELQDPQLDALMAVALVDNLDLAQGHARLAQAQALARSVTAARRPSVQLQGAAGRVRQKGLLGPETFDSYQLSAAASFEIDLWRKLASRSEAARLDVQAASRELQTLYLSLSAQVADLYYLVVEQRAQLALVDETVYSFADTLARVETRYRQGLVPPLDVYQSRQNLAAARARRPVVEQNLAAAEHALAVLVGRTPARTAMQTVKELPALDDAFATGLPATLLQRRPDIAAAYSRLRADDARIAAAIAERFPSFNLVADYGGADSELASLLDSPNIFWNLLLNLAQPLLDGGRRRAEVDRQRALFDEHLAAYRQTVLQALQEVEDALVQERAADERIDGLQQQVTATAGALRLATDRYLLGLSEYLPVLTAQISHAEAQSNLLEARRLRIVARISLARAVGGDWMESLIEQRDNQVSSKGMRP